MSWSQFSIKSDPVVIGDRAVIAKWTGKARLGKAWVLHYWGHPLVGKLPKSLQPNGKVGHQYLECENDAALVARYGEIVAALRKAAPKLALAGPEPDAPNVISALKKKHAYFSIPKNNGMTLGLEPATALLRAEHVLAGDNESAESAAVFETPAGGPAIIAALSGRTHVTTEGAAIVFVSCPKSGEQKALASVLAGKIACKSLGKLAVKGKQLALAPARDSGAKPAIEVACAAGTYDVATGYDYPVSVLRLVRT